jgi:hypothetical protein
MKMRTPNPAPTPATRMNDLSFTVNGNRMTALFLLVCLFVCLLRFFLIYFIYGLPLTIIQIQSRKSLWEVSLELAKGMRPRQGSLHKFVRINDRVMEILVCERKIGERFNDTIFRLIREKGELAKENDRLKGLIDR